MSKFYTRWKRPLIRTKILSGLAKYPRYLSDMLSYGRMDGAEAIKLKDTYPCLFDRHPRPELTAIISIRTFGLLRKYFSLNHSFTLMSAQM